MKNFHLVDILIVLGVIIALIVGVMTTKHFRQTADKQIEATSPITFQVFLRGVTVTGEDFPIKDNDKTFITIRNVPYTELNVLNVSSEARKTAIASSKAVDQYILVKDPTQPAIFDAVVTITDTAKITYKPQSRTTLDKTKLSEILGDDLKPFEKVTSYNVLRIK